MNTTLSKTIDKLPLTRVDKTNLKAGLEDLVNGGGGSDITAENVKYSNLNSGLQSTNVQDAIDEIGENLDDLNTQVQGHETALHNIPTLTESDWETLRSASGVQNEVNRNTKIIGVGGDVIIMVEGFYLLGGLSIGDTFNGIKRSSSSYRCSKIECKQGDKFELHTSAGSSAGSYAFVDENNVILSIQIGTGVIINKEVIAPANSKYLYLNDNASNTSYYAGTNRIDILNKRFDLKGERDIFQITSGETKSLSNIRIRKKLNISCQVSNLLCKVGSGYNYYSGYWVEIKNDTIELHKYTTTDNIILTENHSLNVTVGGYVIISEDGNAKADIIVIDALGNRKEIINCEWFGGGSVFINNSSNATSEGFISCYYGDIDKDIWLFGDSYLSYNTNERWTYYLLKYGYTNAMICSQPGDASASLINDFDVLVNRYRIPKYAVWCLGMNDQSDTTTINNSYKVHIDHFIFKCLSNGITPILCTIPSTPTKNHSLKAQYVRNSGCRYIDISSAVEVGGIWRDGLLATDNVHPTPKGAQVIFAKVLSDFPEIMQK